MVCPRVMDHFLGYHKTEDLGPYVPNGVFFTAKNYRPQTVISNKIWVIEGRAVPREYRIVDAGTIFNVVSEKRPERFRTSEQEEGLTIQFRTDEFNDPIEVTNYDWFITLRAKLQNFSRGFARLKDPDCIRELEAAWNSRGTVASHPELADVEKILNDETQDSTTKKRLVDARLGQGRFRDQLERRWENACAVTGCKVASVLRASHIKPWKDSGDDERLDHNNGLLLAAHIDALFDCGLITFRDDGKMLVSREIPGNETRRLQLGGSLSKKLTNSEKSFLQHHRKRVYRDNRQ